MRGLRIRLGKHAEGMGEILGVTQRGAVGDHAHVGKDACRLRLQAGEDQGNAIAAAARYEVADGGGAGGVDHRYLAQAQDEHARRTAKGAQDIVDAIGHGKEQRAGDAVGLDAFRQGRALVRAWCSIEIVHIAFDQVDVQGAVQIMDKKNVDSIGIFILPPSFEVLKARLTARGTEGEEELRTRLRNAFNEVMHYSQFKYVVINQDVPVASRQMASIIMAERQLENRQSDVIQGILDSFDASKHQFAL